MSKLVSDGLMSVEQFQRAVPKSSRQLINQEVIDGVNGMLSTSEAREELRNNLFGFTRVLADGKFKIYDYVYAVRYVTYKMLGDSNIEAYTKTFPDRYQNMLDKGYSSNKISGFVSAYNKNILVNKILEQTLVPVHVLNVDLHQRAINQLAHLMMNAKSEKVQSDSAAKLVDALKTPETQKIELDVGVKEDTAIQELRESTMELVRQQKMMIEAGAMNAKEIAQSRVVREIIDVELEDE